MKKTPAKGSTAKHVGTSKHGRTAKHHPARQKAAAAATGTAQNTVAKHAPHAKARTLAGAGGWACCVAEALGASLRLAGWPVTDGDVLALHVAAGGSRDRGVPILAALRAAGAGLAGARPRFTPAGTDFPPGTGLNFEPGFPVCSPWLADQRIDGGGFGELAAAATADVTPADLADLTVILGLELPGPHAVTLAPDGCWITWGEHYDPASFPDAVVEEAWVVTWP